MILLKIPGRTPAMIETVICDFNGTLALDGALMEGVAERLRALSEQAKVVILTSDTFGTVEQAVGELPVSVKVIQPGSEAITKRYIVDEHSTMSTVFIGNGANDEKALHSAAVGICVLGGEGAYGPSLGASDVVVKSATDALDLLLHPQRLQATLRR